MEFEVFKKFYPYKVRVQLFTGATFEGVITSHNFKDDLFREVSEISIMEDKSIVKIFCHDIKSITKLGEIQYGQ